MIELDGVAAVILEAHEERGPEVGLEMAGANVALFDAAEHARDLLELEGLVCGTFCAFAETPDGGTPIETVLEDGSVERLCIV